MNAMWLLATLLTLTAHADDVTARLRFLITTNHAETIKECEFLHASLIQASRERTGLVPVDATCISSSDPAQADAARKFPLRIESQHEKDGSISLTLKGASEHVVSRKVPAGIRTVQDFKIQRNFQDFVSFVRHWRHVEQLALDYGILESKRVGIDEQGRYFDLTTGLVVSYETAVKLFSEENEDHKSYLAASIQIAAILGTGFIQRELTIGRLPIKWDYNRSWASQKQRLRDGGVWDDTQMITNMFGHPFGGALYYQAARAAGFGRFKSFLIALAASSIWELEGEALEQWSKNDTIVTPVAGAAIGEALYQFSQLFKRSADTPVNRFFAVLFAPGDAIMDWIEGRKWKHSAQLDRFGFTRDIYHRIDLLASVDVASQFRSYKLELDAEVVGLSTYEKAGKVNRLLWGAPMVETVIRAGRSEDAEKDVVLMFKTAIAGWYKQNLVRQPDGRLQGFSFWIGTSSAYDWSMRGKDFIGVVNVLGPSMDVVLHVRGLRIRAKIDLYGDFAMVRSFALDQYVAEHGLEGPDGLNGAQKIIKWHKYYFAYGVTFAPKLEASYGNWEAGGELKLQSWDSVKGGYARSEQITHELRPSDSRRQARAWLRYTLPLDYLKLGLSFEQEDRRGTLEELSEERHIKRVFGELLLRM